MQHITGLYSRGSGPIGSIELFPTHTGLVLGGTYNELINIIDNWRYGIEDLINPPARH